MTEGIAAEGLRKSYGSHRALQGVDLYAETGTVLGVLGPNGAGKTTAVRVLTTLLPPDGGTARVAGYDVVREPDKVRERIGLTGQYAAVDERLTGRENLRLMGTLYHLGRKTARTRADELLERFDLTDAADRLAKTYSGGMRRRLDLAASLIAAPPELFLDEPTTGLDPASRLTVWDLVRAHVRDGVTVLLTTQYLEEADHLADDLVVIDQGSVIASGPPASLKRKAGSEVLHVVFATPADAVAAAAAVPLDAQVSDRAVTVQVRDGLADVSAVISALQAAGLSPVDFTMRGPSLEEVFPTLTHKEKTPV